MTRAIPEWKKVGKKSRVDLPNRRATVRGRRVFSLPQGLDRMSHPKRKINISNEEFVTQYEMHGPQWIANQHEVAIRNVHYMRAAVEKEIGRALVPPTGGGTRLDSSIKLNRQFHEMEIKNGVVLIGSDGHYWPGYVSTAHRAFVEFGRKLRPKAVVFNGDALDGASISRHPPIGWEEFPTLEDELLECQARLGEIVKAAPRGCQFFWPLGNHDARFNTRLAAVTPEFRNIPGTRLVHHFPEWTPCWAVELGGRSGAVVKHRFKGGMHAPHNNALWSGRSIITGHLHSQKVMPISDYNGTRWGVDTGCLASIQGKQFTYCEENPQNWRSGFAVLTWRKGLLLPPELVTVLDEEKGLITWRGEVLHV